MSTDIQQGFWLGPWKVEPLRGAITGANGDTIHLGLKVMDVFVYLAEHANEMVSRDQLLKNVWAGNDAADELLTGAISDLRRVLLDDRSDPQYIETLPKRGYRLIGDIRLLQGIKLDKDVDRSETITHFTGRKLSFAVIGLVAVAMLYVVLDNYVLEKAPSETAEELTQDSIPAPVEIDKSIAVLPFRNRSALAEDAYFVDGIQDDILTHLARLSFLEKVISRTSMEQYRETTKSMRQIGQELGVAIILEGGVQRAGGRVRINVQLIDAATDEHLWVESYDRQLTAENIFAIQSEIATAIVDALQATLSAEDRASLTAVPTENMKALEYYFLGKDRIPVLQLVTLLSQCERYPT